jgi:hypothetical protein
MTLPARALTALCLVVASAAAADPDPVQQIIDAGLRSDGAYRKLAWLTDRIGPRLSGSENLEKAVGWCKDEMTRDRLDDVRTEKVMVPHWVRGEASGRILAPAAHPLALLALGMSDGTPPEGITAGVVEVTSLEEARALGDKAKGKIVLYNKRIYSNGGDDRGYGSAVNLRYQGAIEAAKVGAVGMLIRSLATADFRLPHTGGMAYQDGVRRIPGAAIAPEDAELIHRFLAAGETVTVTFTMSCKSLPDAASANVVGDVKGSGPRRGRRDRRAPRLVGRRNRRAGRRRRGRDQHGGDSADPIVGVEAEANDPGNCVHQRGERAPGREGLRRGAQG